MLTSRKRSAPRQRGGRRGATSTSYEAARARVLVGEAWVPQPRDPSFSGRLLDLVADEEAGRAAPYGRALDIGTGSAIWAIALAKRGWQVTGVDIVDRALERGRQRAADADVKLDLVHADATELAEAGIGSGYRPVVRQRDLP